MPNNLTPEQLIRLQQVLNPSSGSGWTPESGMGYFNEGGTNYQPYSNGGGFGGAVSYGENATKPGDAFQNYGADGAFSNDGQFKDMSGLDPLLLAFLAAAGGMAAFAPGGFMAGGGGTGGLGAGALGDSTTFGYGIPGEVAATGGGMGGVGATGAGTGGLGATTYGATGGPSAFMQGAGITGAGTGTAGALTGGNALTNVLGGASGLTGLLGPAATLLGAAAGAQGADQSQTQEKKMPPWLEALYRDEKTGLLPMSLGLLQSQQPQNAQKSALLNAMGTNLLNTPLSGNGYTRHMQRAR